MPSFSPNYEASPIKGINESPSLSSALTKRKVYPGDSITSTFTLGSGGWTDSWSLSPGSAGASAGQISQSGSSSNTFSKWDLLDISSERLLTVLDRKLEPLPKFRKHLFNPQERNLTRVGASCYRIAKRCGLEFWSSTVEQYLDPG
jgi:hypothetical protein